jgi:hypothetical protein
MLENPLTMGTDHRPLVRRLGVNRRTVQIALGVIWIVDAGLQFQPKMFTQQFVNHVLLAGAASQPSWLAAAVTHMANFVSHEVAMWNALFGLFQLAIGVGLLFRRTVKVALVTSFAWVFFVWVFGEGMGQIFTGSSSALMGAPGAVLLYGLIGVLVWPTPESKTNKERTGLASSAAGHGPLGARGALIAWTALWAGLAVLFLFPDNRTPNGIRDMIAGMSSGEPGWYAHFLNAIAHAFVGAGTWTAVLLAALCLLVAVGPLVSRDPLPFLVGGAGLGLLFWVTGEALGGILTGLGTDPSSGPLLVLLATALLPTMPALAGSTPPAIRFFTRRPGWAVAALAGLIVVPVAVASVPLAATAAPGPTSGAVLSAEGVSSSLSSGQSTKALSASGMGMSMSGSSGASSHPTKGTTNMAGMAGSGATDPSWHYTGPALPKSEVALLSTSSVDQDKGHSMQTPDCTATPTTNQVLGATQYVQAVTTAVAKYKVLTVATAAGYIPVTPMAYPVVHYVNPSFMTQRFIMDPNHIDSLVYAFTPNGPVLVAAMFLLPSSNENGPMPYGCLVQWHAHTNLCYSDTTHTVVGFTPCSAGEFNARTAYMTHVWQVQVSGGPLAIDPSDLQVMEAAIEAQQSGLAPVTSSTGTVSYNQATAPVGAF